MVYRIVVFISFLVFVNCSNSNYDNLHNEIEERTEKIYDPQGELRYLFEYDSLGNRVNNYPILRIETGENQLKVDSTYLMKITVLNLDSNNFNSIKLGITDSINKKSFTDTLLLDMQTYYKGKFNFQVPNTERIVFVACITELDTSRASISDTLSIHREHWANNVFKTYSAK